MFQTGRMYNTLTNGETLIVYGLELKVIPGNSFQNKKILLQFFL